MKGKKFKEFVTSGGTHDIRVVFFSLSGGVAGVQEVMYARHGGVGVEGVVSRGGGWVILEVAHAVAVLVGEVGEVGW